MKMCCILDLRWGFHIKHISHAPLPKFVKMDLGFWMALYAMWNNQYRQMVFITHRQPSMSSSPIIKELEYLLLLTAILLLTIRSLA